MRLLPFSACASLLCLLLPPAQQDPGANKPTLTDSERKTAQAKVDQMQGLWRVVEIRTAKTPQTRREEVGYLLVSGLCFSLELHWGWVGPDGVALVNKDFQSGTHRFEMDDAGNMETSSIIGSYFNRDGLLQWEKPGQKRRYKIDQNELRMTWSNDDGTSFTFEHMPEPRFVKRDVFGRPLPEKKKDGAKKDD